VVGGFSPAVRGNVLDKPRAAGVNQEPPLPVAVELAPEAPGDPALAGEIEHRLREVLLVRMEVQLVSWGSLQRSEYKSRLLAT
jgi:phenylacetate-CoA ligase